MAISHHKALEYATSTCHVT